jgi:hypothetical protein
MHEQNERVLIKSRERRARHGNVNCVRRLTVRLPRLVATESNVLCTGVMKAMWDTVAGAILSIRGACSIGCSLKAMRA